MLAREAGRKGTASFVLRLWLESAGSKDCIWRWQVYHVQSGRQRYFGGLKDMLEFVAECAEVEPPQTSSHEGEGRP
jgi:hypothetical protein